MTTSGTTSYNLTCQQACREALELLGVVGPYDSLAGEDYITTLRTLNLMVKHWESKGIFVFTETEGTVFLNPGQSKYQLGGTNADKAASVVVETATTVSSASGANTLTVNSTVGITAGDNIGIQLEDGTLQWTTVDTVTNDTDLVLDANLTQDVATDAYIYSYTTQIERPLHVSSVRLRKSGGTDSTLISYTQDLPIVALSRKVFFNIPNRFIQGSPVQYYVDRQRTSTDIYVYPCSDSTDNRLKITYRRSIEDFTSSTDLPDFPNECAAAIVYNLADWVAPKFEKENKVGMDPNARADIKAKASELMNDMLANNQEKTSYKLRPKIPGS